MTDTKPQTLTNVNGQHVAGEAFWILKPPAALADPVAARSIDKATEAWRAKVAARKEAEAEKFRQKMAEPVTTEIPKLVQIRAGDVRFDERYQTTERRQEWRAKIIAEEFDWTECKPINLNVRPDDPSGVAWCYDGWHRVTAAIMRLGPDTIMNATLIRVPYEREAEKFAEQDRLSKKVPARIKFRALIEAGNPDATAQKAMLDRLGVAFGLRAATRTIALNTFLECCRMKGAEATEEGLSFVLGAWGGAAESLEGHIAKGVIWFVANRSADPSYRPQRVRDVLGRVSVREIEKAAGSKGEKMTTHQRVASVVVDLYNRALPTRLAIADWNPRKDR